MYRVEQLLSLMKSPTTLKYKIMDSEPLKTWVHSSGRVTLVGDACHPMTVHLVLDTSIR